MRRRKRIGRVVERVRPKALRRVLEHAREALHERAEANAQRRDYSQSVRAAPRHEGEGRGGAGHAEAGRDVAEYTSEAVVVAAGVIRRPVSRGVVDRRCHDVQCIYINRYRYECRAAHCYDGAGAAGARRQRFRCVRCFQRICADE